jgi:hypothetical protein
MTRPLLAVAAVGAALLAVPSGASGATALTIGPTAVRGYDLTLRVGGGDDLGVLTLRKERGKSVQTHTYEFRGVKTTLRRGGTRGRVTAKLGKGEKIDLRWRTTGGRKTVPYGAGCTGKLRVRPGRLTGTLKMELPYEMYYGTLTRHRLKGRTEVPSGVRCPAEGAAAPGTSLTTLYVDAGRRLALAATRSPKGVPGFAANYEGGDVIGTHNISTTGVGSLTNADDLSSAEVVVGGPFLSGRLGFTGNTPASATERQGPLDGDLTIDFDGISTLQVLTLATSTLKLR